ncbi:MAG TPA: hypothetical protein VG497_30595 [Kribbella sp.]|nr:hypothetical protein [Kribbella sp.]
MTADPRIVAAAWAVVAVCVAIGVAVVLADSPAQSVKVPQSVIARPLSKPGPPVPARIHGDGTFVVGKQVKAGSYRTAGGPRCRWARLDDLRGLPGSVRDSGPAPTWTQVDLIDGVVGFETHGCAEWVMVR